MRLPAQTTARAGPEQYYNCDGECINDVNDNDICDEFDVKGACRISPATSTPDDDPDTSCIYPETIATTTTLKRSTTR